MVNSSKGEGTKLKGLRIISMAAWFPNEVRF